MPLRPLSVSVDTGLRQWSDLLVFRNAVALTWGGGTQLRPVTLAGGRLHLRVFIYQNPVVLCPLPFLSCCPLLQVLNLKLSGSLSLALGPGTLQRTGGWVAAFSCLPGLPEVSVVPLLHSEALGAR